MSRTRNAVWLIAAAGAVSLPIYWLNRPSKGEGGGPPRVLADTGGTVARVAVVEATRSRLVSEMAVTAEFRADQEVEVMAKVSGYLKKIEVDVGDRVEKGQLLATVEIPELDDDLAKNAAAILRSQAELIRAEEDVKRAETARQMTELSYSRLAAVIDKRPGLVAQQELDTVRNRDLLAQSQIAGARASFTAAAQAVRIHEAEATRIRTLQGYSKIVAPFAGVVTRRFADTGAMIQAGISSHTQAMPLVRIAQTGVLRLVLPVPESMVPRLKKGTPVEVRVESLGRTFTGRVARLSGQIQTATRTMETEVDVPNPTGVLVPGMFAQAVLRVDERPHALSVPVDAVERDKDAVMALVVSSGNKLERRKLVTGLETAERVEVRSGISEGELVVVGNRSQFREGQKVEPKRLDTAASEKSGG